VRQQYASIAVGLTAIHSGRSIVVALTCVAAVRVKMAISASDIPVSSEGQRDPSAGHIVVNLATNS